MARYINIDKVKPDCISTKGGVAISQSQLTNQPTADVIERTEYEKLKKENEELKNILADKSVLEEDGYYKTSCNLIKKVFDMDFKMQEIERSKIDKAKKQITDSMNEHLGSDGTPIDEYAYCYLNVLEILEENIGE